MTEVELPIVTNRKAADVAEPSQSALRQPAVPAKVIASVHASPGDRGLNAAQA